MVGVEHGGKVPGEVEVEERILYDGDTLVPMWRWGRIFTFAGSGRTTTTHLQ